MSSETVFWISSLTYLTNTETNNYRVSGLNFPVKRLKYVESVFYCERIFSWMFLGLCCTVKTAPWFCFSSWCKMLFSVPFPSHLYRSHTIVGLNERTQTSRFCCHQKPFGRRRWLENVRRRRRPECLRRREGSRVSRVAASRCLRWVALGGKFFCFLRLR